MEKRKGWRRSPGTKMPEHFRWKLNCKSCPAGMEADGHTMDAYLSSHIEAFGHKQYDLTISTTENTKEDKEGQP